MFSAISTAKPLESYVLPAPSTYTHCQPYTHTPARYKCPSEPYTYTTTTFGYIILDLLPNTSSCTHCCCTSCQFFCHITYPTANHIYPGHILPVIYQIPTSIPITECIQLYLLYIYILHALPKHADQIHSSPLLGYMPANLNSLLPDLLETARHISLQTSSLPVFFLPLLHPLPPRNTHCHISSLLKTYLHILQLLVLCRWKHPHILTAEHIPAHTTLARPSHILPCNTPYCQFLHLLLLHHLLSNPYSLTKIFCQTHTC